MAILAASYYHSVMPRLFPQPEAPCGDVHVVAVAVATNVWGSYDYIWPAALGEPSLGQRVHVPFGRANRVTLAFVVDTLASAPTRKLKAVADVIDTESQFDQCLWKLGQWISEYYLSPPGMTLAAMIPSAVGRHAPRSEAVVFLEADPSAWPARLGSRQRRVLDMLHEARRQGVEPLVLQELMRHSGASRDSVARLSRRSLVRLMHRPVSLSDAAAEVSDDPFELNGDQEKVLADLAAKLGEGAGFSATLLHGVTGSGKTEVYIRAIRRVASSGRQAILLVPEIALATQTLQRLLERLGRVAVLHSGLTDAQRAFQYGQIRDGHADVVVGPRSAVFAPARKLGLIIVDEEHESSYKQDTVPRYHGRDVAVMRASLAGAAVLLGSATPSLESLRNVELKRYHLLRLPRRVGGLPMPALEIVRLRDEITTGRVELIGRTLTSRIAAALDRREQIILLMNRRGYASYVFCPSCKWEMTCENCTRTMVFHQATRMVLCHYCGRSEALPDHCPACRGKLLLFGMGIQRIESELARKFPAANVARMDSDTMTSPAQFRKVFDDFRDGRLDILLGTQMVAKGLDFPRVSLVGVVSGDTSLSIPDFRAAERTFQLIVQVAGRAGRKKLNRPAGSSPGEVVVQTLHPDEPAICLAARHDCAGFAALESSQRRQANLPPYSRMIRFVVRHADVSRAQQGADEVARRLGRLLSCEKVSITGPQPAGVVKIRGQFRFEILLVTSDAGAMQRLLRPRMGDMCRAAGAEVIADVDPVNLL